MFNTECNNNIQKIKILHNHNNLKAITEFNLIILMLNNKKS